MSKKSSESLHKISDDVSDTKTVDIQKQLQEAEKTKQQQHQSQEYKMYLPIQLRNKQNGKANKIYRICKYSGHDYECPFVYKEGKCTMIHC